MAAPGIPVRCTSCGTELRAVLAPSPSTQWFPCPHCHAAVPVVMPRDPPPLYSWEVLPGLYPPLPMPRPPRWSLRTAATIALVAVTILAVVLGALLAFYGVEAGRAAEYSVSGTVYEQVGAGLRPAGGALVILTEEGNRTVRTTTALDGTFAFANVPSGGVALNVTHAGFAPVTVDTFVSPVYDAGTTGIAVTLHPLGTSNGSTIELAPFSDLESFLSSLTGGAGLLLLVALVAGLAASATRRGTARTAAVIGGGAGAGMPAILLLLGLDGPFPVLLAVASLGGAVGAFALASGTAGILTEGSEP